jgi:phosphomannomutase
MTSDSAASTTADLEARARAWLADDPDAETRAELEKLIGAGEWDELTDRFRMRLEFGTAGLRGVLGAGPNRMNRAVVRAASAGFCSYLIETTPNARERGIAIGYDGRRGSVAFAEETAEVATAAGFKVFLFGVPVPTPIVGFTCLERNAAGGVVVTASHNPPEYNGYKVYWSNGAQIIPPHDIGIAAAIEKVGKLADVPRKSLADAEREGLLIRVGDESIDHYHAAIAELVPSAGPGRDLGIAYTALHGVGDVHVRRALANAGFANVYSVASQAEPDGSFPTVRFPNPEEKGAMDRVLALAKEKNAPLVIANDPDADRLAVAARKDDGSYVQLTGNEVGTLFGHTLLSRSLPTGGGKRAVVSSLVSSPMLGSIAKAHDAHWEETLTGFKWIANRAIELEREGFRFEFGYEEALGYTIGTVVSDKDGVSAALVFADLAARCHAEGRSVLDELDVCARKYGLYLSRQVSVTKTGQDGAEAIRATMDAVRSAPPAKVGTHQVIGFSDLSAGTKVVTMADGSSATEKLAFLPSNVISMDLAGGHRIMLRPSGTEPKIKYYFDIKETIGAREHTLSARERGERVLKDLIDSFLPLVGEKA